MDKFEYNLKIGQLRQYAAKRDIEAAVEIADEMDWRKEKDVSVLVVAADAYELYKEYKKAKEILILAYEKSQTGRQLAFRLALLSTKTGEFDEAEEFYQDFVEIAPRDTSRYVLQYRIMKAKGEPVEQLIPVLEEYVEVDMEERWMYELAKLYHIAGEEEKCVDLCDEMSLWFSHGKYVNKAMDLKRKYKPLTKRQEENYNKPDEESFVQQSIVKEVEEKPIVNANLVSDVKEKKDKHTTIPFTTIKLGDVRDIMNKLPDISLPQDNKEPEKVEADAEPDVVKNEAAIEESKEEHVSDMPTKPIGTEGFETIDLQAELAKNMEAILGTAEDAKEDDEEQTIVAGADRLVKEIEKKAAVEESVQEADKKVEAEEVVEETDKKAETEEADKKTEVEETVETVKTEEKPEIEEVAEETTEENKPKRETISLPPLFKYEANGQIGLDIEQPKKEDKQITGQLSIEEVLRNLEQRGILKADTVSKTVETMDQAASAVDEAAEEAAILEKEEKENTTVVEDVTDVIDDTPKEVDFADDAKEGFVYTDQIDTDAINKALEAQKADGLDVTAEINPADLIQLETGADIVAGHMDDDTDAVPILDLSFDTHAKKLTPGIAPSVEPVAANTESLNELFAGLNIATKADGEEADTAEAEKAVDEVETEAKSAETKAVETKEEVEADTDETTEVVEEEVAAEAEVEEKVEAEEENASEETAEAKAEEAIKENTEAEEKVSDTKATEGSEDDGMPKISVTTNKNLTQTLSLDINSITVSDEELKVFESFKSVNGLEQKIVDTVTTLAASYDASGNSKTGNIMILGDDKSGKTTMAIEMIKLINKKRGRKGRRIAKVDSSVLNSRGIRSSMKKLVGSDLIVENAQQLRKNIQNEFVSVAQYYTDDMLIVFEGETSGLKNMIRENDDIKEMFNHVLVIKEYDVKEWVAYAKQYAASENYMIDEMGTLALYKSIDDFYSKHQGIDQNDVDAIIDRAIKKASGKVTRKLTNLFSGKNDDNGMDILKEKDFK